MNEISYYRKNDEIECVHYRDWNKTYAEHTHTGHVTVGYVEKGKVCIVMDGVAKIYTEGSQFVIFPNVVHEIRAVEEETYSMLVMCIKTDTKTDDDCLEKLKNSILEKPENAYLIEEMARDSNISPYYLIRQFKKAFGLTPHQFQMQCKVRKAQKLLEEKSVSEVTYDAGFCDQSHMDRCFHKVVGLTPKQYKKSVRKDV